MAICDQLRSSTGRRDVRHTDDVPAVRGNLAQRPPLREYGTPSSSGESSVFCRLASAMSVKA